MGSLDDAKVEIVCPTCHRRFEETLGTLKLDPVIRCPGCRQPIQVQADRLRSDLEKVERGLAEPDRTLGDLRTR